MSNLGNKNVMAKNLKKYIKLSGKERKEICNDLGFSYSTFSDWVNGKAYPRIDKIELMARYFGIQKSDLIESKSDSNTPAYYLDDEARELAQFACENPEYKTLFDASRKVKPEDIKFVIDMIERLK